MRCVCGPQAQIAETALFYSADWPQMDMVASYDLGHGVWHVDVNPTPDFSDWDAALVFGAQVRDRSGKGWLNEKCPATAICCQCLCSLGYARRQAWVAVTCQFLRSRFLYLFSGL